MRLAFISLMSGLPWGGSEELWYKIAANAMEQEHIVLVSVFDWGKLSPKIATLKQQGAIINLRPRFNSNGSMLYKTTLYFKNRINWLNNTYKSILRFKPDHVIINQGETFDIAIHHYKLFELLKSNNISYSLICHSHTQYGDIPTKDIYPGAVEIFQSAHKVFFVSNRMQQITERKLCTKLTNTQFTWNPLNLKTSEYIPWPKNSMVQFAMVGNLGNNKGHDTLLECLKEEKWKDRQWHLNIYGTGYGEKYLKDLTKFYHLENKITFHGHVSAVAEIWLNNHLLLIPSASEGTPISLIEALICGRPATVSDIGGNGEVITENINGFIAEAPSVSSFSNAMERAWENKEKWEGMGKNAHEYCMKNVDLNPQITLLNSIVV